jgi:hypothetical protein
MSPDIRTALATAIALYEDDAAAADDYRAAARRLTALIIEAVAAIEVAATATVGDPDAVGGCSCQADIEIEATVAGLPMRATGWAICGWLPVGAHADLDGSGLACWGSSQPGGWSSCGGDGQSNGTPYASAADRSKINLDGAEGGQGSMLDSADILIAAGIIADADRAAIDDHTYMDGISDAIAAHLQAAIDACDLSVAEPDAEAVWDELGTDIIPGVRAGDPWHAGQVVVVERGDEYQLWLAGEAWESAIESAAVAAVRRVLERSA